MKVQVEASTLKLGDTVVIGGRKFVIGYLNRLQLTTLKIGGSKSSFERYRLSATDTVTKVLGRKEVKLVTSDNKFKFMD